MIEVEKLYTENGIKSLRDMVYVKADKYKKETKVRPSGLILWQDVDVQKYHEDRVCQDGIVKYIPGKIQSGEIEVKEGDHVYTHHFLTEDQNAIEINDELLYAISYESVYCVVNNGDIKMLGKWNFLKPILEKDQLDNGLYFIPKNKYDTKKAIVEFTSKEMQEDGLKKGDIVFFSKNSDYVINVEGEYYFRVENEDIIGIFKE